MSLTELARGKYVSLTTYKRDGSSSATPVWIADLGDGTVGFTTSSASLKVKRILHDPRVSLQSCNMRGVVREDSTAVAGVATIVDGAEYARVLSIVKHKYGMQYKVMIGLDKIAGVFRKKDQAADCAVVVASPE